MIDSSYSPTLVATSVVIASLASYTALDLAGRVTAAQGRGRLAWLASGSAAMGLGIWSMHFVGMLAFRMPIEIAYDVPLVVLSALIAIAASGLAMVVVSRVELPTPRLIVAGVIMGIAIAGMHYTGMAAMRMPAALSYDPARVWASIGIAITASMVALWIAFRLRHDDTVLGRWRRAGSAVVMGFAIAGMHYTGMSAARFAPRAVSPAIFAHTIAAGAPLAIAVIGGALLVLVLALVGTTVDRRSRLAAALEKSNALLQAQSAELEEQNARLQEQAVELEQQRGSAQALAAELEQRNIELGAALATAEAARNAAQAANRAKSEFLAVMSHELRTPLNAIVGYGELLGLEVSGPVTRDQREKIDRMQRAARHLVSLINQVLDFERVAAGREQVLMEQTEIGALVRDALADVEPQAAAKGITLRIEAPSTPLAIVTDVAKFRQIVLNLLSNAVKYTDNGEIHVHAGRVNGTLQLSVCDTGIGIEPEQQTRIFDPFWQADQRLTRQRGGTGLGLSIVRQFARLLGGEVTVESTPGRGSTFTLQLPLGPALPRLLEGRPPGRPPLIARVN